MAKSLVSERKQGTDRYNRTVYGWTDIHHADGRDHPNAECSESTKERWKRESVCRSDHTSYAAPGCNADSIEKSL